jgi:hypothetical protein
MQEKDLIEFSPDELKLFMMIQALMEDNFTGSIVIHISEGDVRKVETTQVERYQH